MNETNTYKNLKDKPKDNFPVMIIVHHSGGTDANPLQDTSNQSAADMEAWHLHNGWEGLGYHYVIHKNGDVWKGRPEHYHGSHAVGHNTDSIGICLAGNFDATLPTTEQVTSLTNLMKDICSRYPIGDKIYPHRKFANKTCYGKNLTDDWAKNLVAIKPTTTKDILLRRLLELTKLVQEME
jgi:N-acetylmuramoyl-L-alanine amidase